MTGRDRPTMRPVDRVFKLAVAAGSEAAVRLHIERGDRFDWRDERGLTPLMIAAQRDKAAICGILIAAGADPSEVDDDGRDALAIARAAGATAAIEAISIRAHAEIGKDFGSPPEASQEPVGGSNASVLPPVPGGAAELVSAIELGLLAPPSNDSDQSDPMLDGSGYVFGDWMPERPSEPPANDPARAAADAARQQRIDSHAPLNDSAAWDHFEADLPDSANPFSRLDDEARAATRGLLLLATREGSIPRLSIEDVFAFRADAETRDLTAESALLATLGAMGSESDERLEHQVGDDSFEIYIDPVENVVEEDEVDEALAFFEDARSGRSEPLRLYLRSLGHKALLTAAQEGEIARAMEAAVSRAVDALSNWPEGIERMLAEVAGAENSPASLGLIVAAPNEDEVAEVSTGMESRSSTFEEDSDDDDASEGLASQIESMKAFARIRELVASLARSPEISAEIRDLLGALAFRRPFLAGLVDERPNDACPASRDYGRAIADLLRSRDAMALGNVRLVNATARRYLKSGLPLDDLIQEGNIGLLKAVDRFDWRRGFKFSTMATWWIKQQIGRFIGDNGLTIRMPTHVHEKIYHLRVWTETFERANGRSPSPSEQAAMLGVSAKKMALFAMPGSDPMSTEDAEDLGFLMGDESDEPFELLAAKEVAAVLDARIEKLPGKQGKVLRLRFGIGIAQPRTLEQVGATFEVTRERIRQIEAAGLRVLSSRRALELLAKDIGAPIPHDPRDGVVLIGAAEDGAP